MSKCICPDWRENINALDAPIVFAAARTGLPGYPGADLSSRLRPATTGHLNHSLQSSISSACIVTGNGI